MFMLLSEQARGQPGARRHHAGDPWYKLLTGDRAWLLALKRFISSTATFLES